MPEIITIIGGGLTGLSLAIALRKNGIAVILHEAGEYPRHRVCGEFISGVSAGTLDALGIAEALSDALCHHSVTWFSGNEILRKTRLPDPALAISRHLLDDRLKHLALAVGVELHTSSRQQAVPQPGLIWTAGRIPARGKWIGLKAHVRGIPLSANLEMHSGSIGYLGITPIEGGWNNLCGLFKIDRSIPARHEQLLPAYLLKNGNSRLAESLASAEWKPDSFTAVAGFRLGLQKPEPGLLCLGDSHAIIPPFTGNGMTMAFQSAEIALPHLISFADGHSTWPETCTRISASLHKHFRKRLSVAKFIHPLLFKSSARPLLKAAPLTPILRLIR